MLLGSFVGFCFGSLSCFFDLLRRFLFGSFCRLGFLCGFLFGFFFYRVLLFRGFVSFRICSALRLFSLLFIFLFGSLGGLVGLMFRLLFSLPLFLRCGFCFISGTFLCFFCLMVAALVFFQLLDRFSRLRRGLFRLRQH